MFDRPAVEAMAQAQSKHVAELCYYMGEPKPWGLGFVFWVAERWQDVGRSLGMTYEELRPLRGLFESQFVDACIARLQHQMTPRHAHR